MATKKTKRKSMRRAAKGKRETSDRVSRIAGRVLRKLEGWPANEKVSFLGGYSPTVGELRALAASCLSQDQTPGKRTQ